MPKDSTSPAHALRVTIGQHSLAGRKPTNQDFHGSLIPDGPALTHKGITVAIADGISSSPISAEASEISIKSIMIDYFQTSDAWTVKTAATTVISATNAWLYAQNRRDRTYDMNRGRVCTLSALIFKGRTAHLFHIGDSRVWRISGGALEPLTQDHRVTISAEESYLARAMGLDKQVEVDYRKIPLSPGDIFILTTDGVHEYWNARDVAKLLETCPPQDAAQKLVDDALAAGSTDNLTAQIVRVDDLPEGRVDEFLHDLLTLPKPELPNPNDMIDGFRIIRAIHSTARSHVYLAQAPDGAHVALKIPSHDLRDDPDYLRRFVMEEWTARRINSAHVLGAAATPAERTSLYVVTQYIEGQTLRQWMTDNPQPSLTQVRDLIEQIVQGVRAFHRREMLHQDLRPENIMIDQNGTVKIIDFGATRIAGVQEGTGPDHDILGTLQYSAPEYFIGDAPSTRSDQFSIGVIAYEMLTGQLPYGRAVSQVRTRRDLGRLSYKQARNDTNHLPDWIDDTLRKAVNPDPFKRHDVLSGLVGGLRQPDSGYQRSHTKPLAERDPVRFWKTIAVGLAILCIILAVT